MKTKEIFTSKFDSADTIEAIAKDQEKMQLKKLPSSGPEENEKPSNNSLPVLEFSNLSLSDKDDSSEEAESTNITPNETNEDEKASNVADDAEFDPSQLRAKGPDRNNLRARQSPYLNSNIPRMPASQHTLINGPQMSGARITLENDTFWRHNGNENIPTLVEEFESSNSTSGSIVPDIESEVRNVAPNEFQNIMNIIEHSKQLSLFNVSECSNTPEGTILSTHSPFPDSPYSEDSAYGSHISGSPASRSSCPNDSPGNSPNSSYQDWLPPAYYDEADRFPRATYVEPDYGSLEFDQDAFGNSSRNLVELQPSQNIQELGSENIHSGYCDLPVCNIPTAQNFAPLNFPSSEGCIPNLEEPLLECSRFPFEEMTSYLPNIPPKEDYPSLDLAQFSEPAKNLTSPSEASPITSPDYGLSKTRVYAQIQSIPVNIAPGSQRSQISKPLNEKKKNNIIDNNQRTAHQRDPPPILPTGSCQNNVRRTKTKSRNQTLEQRLHLKMQPQRRMAIWKALIVSKEDLGMKNEDNQTTLMQLLLRSPKPSALIERVYIRINMMKIDKNTDLLTCRDKFGHSALYQAATLHPDVPELAAYIAETYAALGCNVNEVFNDGNTLLHCLAELGEKYENVLEELLKLSANGKPIFMTNACNALGDTPLHIAARNHLTKNSGSEYNIASILMKNGANVCIQNAKLETPLHVAAASNACDPNYFRKLLERRGAENIPDAKGNTPLHLVALNVGVHNKASMKKVIECLLTSAAVTDVKNHLGQTPIMNVHQHYKEEFIGLLSTKRQ